MTVWSHLQDVQLWALSAGMLLGSSSENISAISNATSSTLDEKEQWSPTLWEGSHIGWEKKTDPHTRWEKLQQLKMTLLVKTVLAPEAIFDWNDNIWLIVVLPKNAHYKHLNSLVNYVQYHALWAQFGWIIAIAMYVVSCMVSL
jgi:hypothetical protein